LVSGALHLAKSVPKLTILVVILLPTTARGFGSNLGMQ